jgi:hypothetical protein
MKKSELKRIIREEMGLPQPPVKVTPEKDPKGGRRKVGFVKNKPPKIGQESDRKINESGISTDLPTIKTKAKQESRECGCAQHVNEKSKGVYTIEDFYDADTTVASFENGRQLNENINEVMVGGEMVDPNVVSAIMAAVPTLVALGAGIEWRKEIAAWVRQMKAKYAK